MPVIDITKDAGALTMTVTAEFDATMERTWQLWADPRQLERWWGPPTHPATVTDHDLQPGGRVAYFMTGPEGERYHGYWDVLEVDSPRHLHLKDGFAGDDGTPDESMPESTMTVRIEARDGGGSRMVLHSTFDSTEGMQQQIEMGMEAGIRAAVGQIDGLLAGATS